MWHCHTIPYHAILRFWFFSKRKLFFFFWKTGAAFIPDNFVTFFNTPNDRFHPRNCRAGTLCRFNTLQPLIMRDKSPRLIHTDAAKWKDITLDLFTAKYPKYFAASHRSDTKSTKPSHSRSSLFSFSPNCHKALLGGGPSRSFKVWKVRFLSGFAIQVFVT